MPHPQPLSATFQYTGLASYCQALHLLACGFLWLLKPALPTRADRPERPGNSCLLVAALSQWLLGAHAGTARLPAPCALELFPEFCDRTKLHLPPVVMCQNTHSLFLPSLGSLPNSPSGVSWGLPPK